MELAGVPESNSQTPQAVGDMFWVLTLESGAVIALFGRSGPSHSWPFGIFRMSKFPCRDRWQRGVLPP